MPHLIIWRFILIQKKMIHILIRSKSIFLVVLCVMVGGTSSLAWCLHLDGSSSTHLVANNTDHVGDHGHEQDANSKHTHIEPSCEDHQNDCAHIPLSYQTVASQNSTSINHIISRANQPVPFLSMDWALLFPAASGQFRPPFKSANHVNQQLASLKTTVLLH